jgi:hypothetical protein
MKKTVIFIIVLCLCGCAGTCLRVGGGYKDFSGEVEYCFDTEKSKDLGVPVLEETTESGEKEIFGFSLDQVNAILGKLSGKDTEASEIKHPVKKILEEIE